MNDANRKALAKLKHVPHTFEAMNGDFIEKSTQDTIDALLSTGLDDNVDSESENVSTELIDLMLS
jgi:hypothetical protein